MLIHLKTVFLKLDAQLVSFHFNNTRTNRFTQTDWENVILRKEKHFSISVDLTTIAMTHDAVKET